MKIRNYLAMAVMVIGCLQMVGYATGLSVLRGIGLASGIAPFPKVFCESDGYEAFAARFVLEGVYPDGRVWTRQIDPEFYAQLQGPYNRRNVYGAALAFAPRLPDELRDQLHGAALNPDSALRRELGIPGEVGELKIRITDSNTNEEWVYP